ncbi:MAG: hypothetical protein ACN0LA_02730 [Candidatus Longimicrobiales bacterium M2_2A_002]
MESTNQTNAYDIVRTLRPNWLHERGPSSIHAETPVQVNIDGNRMGGPRALMTVPKVAIEEIRRYVMPRASREADTGVSRGRDRR